jgi:hypothetical protein
MSTANPPNVNELRLVELPLYSGNNKRGEIVVVEGEVQVPFSIKRIFTLRAPTNTVRGGHAHRGCSQFMICTQGVIEINCDDGREQRSFLLDRGNVGLLVPPNMWSTQRFCRKNSVLLVVCDQPYKEQDYIRDYTEFLARRSINRPAVGLKSRNPRVRHTQSH